MAQTCPFQESTRAKAPTKWINRSLIHPGRKPGVNCSSSRATGDNRKKVSGIAHCCQRDNSPVQYRLYTRINTGIPQHKSSTDIEAQAQQVPGPSGRNIQSYNSRNYQEKQQTASRYLAQAVLPNQEDQQGYTSANPSSYIEGRVYQVW